MSVITVIFFVTCFGTNVASSVDNLLNGLAREKWSEEENPCRIDTEAILNGVKNNTLWATWVWDSMQLPVGTFYGTQYHFGNFDQCLTFPWPWPGVQTQYCLVDVTLAQRALVQLNTYHDVNVEKYVGANFPTISVGMCLPASCRPGSVAKITKHIFSLSHLPFQDVVVDPRDCQVAGSTVEKPIGFYVFWLIILSMIMISILIYFLGHNKDESKSTAARIAHSFCLKRNIRELTEVHKDEIRMMNGLRCITSALVVIVHFGLTSIGTTSKLTLVNLMDLKKIVTGGYSWKLTLRSDLLTDIFFVMSGLLHCRCLVTNASCQPLKTLFKRYVRLVPLYALSIACFTYVQPFSGSGPLWPRMVRKNFEPCATSWWRNLLMISNKRNDGSICSVTSWYLHCDFHLTTLGTAIFILYHKNKTTGFIFYWFVFISSAAVTFIWNYWKDLPGLLWYDFEETFDMEINKVYSTVYVFFYTRASAYLIGMAMGYAMAVHKPQKHRKTISKITSVLGFIIGLSLIVVNLPIGNKMFRKEFSPLGMAIMATVDKAIFSVGICLIITVCEYGTLPVINGFFGNMIFVPLSKLCYSIYLFHTIFINKDVFSLRTPARFEVLNVITVGLGYFLITAVLCFFVWLFIEAPVTNLINLIFDLNSNSQKSNATEPIQTNNKIDITEAKKVL